MEEEKKETTEAKHEAKPEVKSEVKHDGRSWYDKWYKILLFPPVIIFIIALIFLGSFYVRTGDFILKDTSLGGGTTITITGADANMSKDDLKSSLYDEFPDIYIRSITDLSSGRTIAMIVESSAEPEKLKAGLEKVLNHTLTDENSSVEFTGSSLSNNFYTQLIMAIIFSFVLMSIVIFVLFRSFIPSIAVIFAAFADIVISVAFINLLGIKLSAAGIAAYLMLIGYSVDTDILLTTRVLKKKEGSVNERIYGSFKTGIFMTLTGLAAVLPAFFIVTGLPESFRQIFLILSVGLFADIFNTWLTNASILKWYTDWKGLR